MFFALCTVFLWSGSAFFAGRATHVLGSISANFWRALIAWGVLAAVAHGWGGGLGGAGLPWLLLSGVIGFGLGDLGLYLALPRIGPRLTLLLAQCLAAPIGMLAEWCWLDRAPRWEQSGGIALILLGVGWAVAPRENLHLSRRQLRTGIAWGVLAAAGQGLGAVITQRANQSAAATGEVLAGDPVLAGLTQAYQRMTGGLPVALLLFLVTIQVMKRRGATTPATGRPFPWAWIMAGTLAGPVAGVAMYQAALHQAPTGVVLAIVATTPLAIIPLSWKFDGDRPGRGAFLGALLAVAGVVSLLAAGNT